MDKANMHIHSKYSWDCKMELEDIATMLINSGIKYGGIADHIEYDREDAKEVINKFKIRNLEIDKLNEKYFGKLVLLKGVEISSPHLYKDEVEKLVELKLDFIMGSIHKIDKTPKTDLEKRQAAYYYYEEILKMVKAHQIDIVGHIDYINRYYNNDYTDAGRLSDLFYQIKANGEIIELNSSGNRRIGKTQKTFPSVDKLRMYARSQVPITIGSDAHELTEITDNLIEAEYTASVLGLKPVIYKRRKMIKLNPSTYR